MGKKFTGLFDDYGNKVYDGDKVKWTWIAGGTMITDSKTGKKRFLPCFPGDMTKKMSCTQTVKFEVRDKTDYNKGRSSGYFLNDPSGIGGTFFRTTVKCKVIKDKKRYGRTK
jgi:hypothetical protein